MFQRLGQHFLINKAAVEKIIAALQLEKGDEVIEIGPGKGALTLPLAEKCEKIGCKIVAIEKDEKMAERLSNSANERFRILTGDALKVLPNLVPNNSITNYKIAGNIPYYITGKLLRIISELDCKPKLTVLTIQREVAERLAAPAGKMNLLAAAVQFWAEPEIIGYLKPSDFAPPPKVNSAIIKLNLLKSGLLWKSDFNRLYYKLIKIVFKQPRKTLLNNLKMGLNPENELILRLKSLGLDEKSRPQDLSIEMLISLLGLV